MELFVREALSLGTGVCQKKNNNSKLFLECCQGYKFNQINQTCDECPEGKYGYNCKHDCLENYFGLRCRERCNCKENETCDKVHGCRVTKNTDTGITLIYAKESSTTFKDKLKVPTESSTTLKDELTIPTKHMTHTLQGDDGGDPVNSIIIAVLLTVLVIIVLVMVWKEREKICRRITDSQMSSVHERHKRRHANEDDENAYSEIRESKMVRPMTVYGRKLSQCDLDNQYNHLSLKQTNEISRINNYLYNMPTEYTEPIDGIGNDCEKTSEKTDQSDRPNES
ncbi:uncharacterized protein LOC127704110 isoform X2 [Mytilus californianus]|uniref:uncharacterized protein LOC127704110 isoform X2 n=1 Tax=Mytilus californianus TaxID=6549 RepID=UPI002246B9B5|nr:uncharacterized protein LOC127704110 isoform X2 [Mytilus californianus]